jgi:hypothetical protein
VALTRCGALARRLRDGAAWSTYLLERIALRQGRRGLVGHGVAEGRPRDGAGADASAGAIG